MKQLLKQVSLAATAKALAALLVQANLSFGEKLNEALQREKNNNTARVIVAIVSIVLVGWVTYLSYTGAGFIFQNGGLVSLIFGLLDISLIVLLLTPILKGKMRWAVLAFEIASFVYFGYTMGGYFGGGSLQSVANKNLSEMYAHANDAYYGDANTLNNMSEQVKQSASAIRQIEEERDGKGVVFEKAGLVSKIELKDIPKFPEPPSAPMFGSLPEGNAWLQAQAANLSQEVQKYQSISKSLTQQAQGLSSGISDVFAQSGLSLMQQANLHSLQKSLDQIGRYPLKNPEISAVTLEKKDFQTDTVQTILGYAIEVVMAFFLVLLTILSNGKKNMEELREEAGLSIIEQYADDENFSYEDLSEVDYKTLERVINMTTEESGVFKKYVKTAKLDDIVNFFEKFPVIGTAMATSKWRFSEIKKAMEADRSFEAEMPEIIQIKKIDWDILSSYCEPQQVLVMSAEIRAKFLEVVDVLRRKVVNDAELQALVKRLVIGGPSVAYYDTLLIFAEKMPANKLQQLTKSFILEIAPDVAKMIIAYVDDAHQLEGINNAWKGDDNQDYLAILGNSVSKDSNFGPLLRLLVNASGIDGLRKFASSYKEKHTEAMQNGLGELISISPTKLDEARKEIKLGNTVAVGTALASILELKSRLI